MALNMHVKPAKAPKAVKKDPFIEGMQAQDPPKKITIVSGKPGGTLLITEVDAPTTTGPHTITMTPENTKVYVEPVSETALQKLTSDFIVLYRKFEAFDGKNLVKKMEDLKKQLQTIANDTVDKDKPAVFSCPLGDVEFTERGTDTEIPNPANLLADLDAKFGGEVAFSVVTIGLTQLRKILSDVELKKYAIELPGSRRLKSVRTPQT